MTSAALPAAPLVYVDCDIPEGLTINEWRRIRREPRSRAARRLRRLAGF
jgi:hypothetical protein